MVMNVLEYSEFDYYWNDLIWIALKGNLTIHPSNNSTVQSGTVQSGTVKFCLTLETLVVKEGGTDTRDLAGAKSWYSTIFYFTVGLAGTRSWYSTILYFTVGLAGTRSWYSTIQFYLSVNFQMNCRVWREGFSNFWKINDCGLKLDSQKIRSFMYQLICFKIQNSKPFNKQTFVNYHRYLFIYTSCSLCLGCLENHGNVLYSLILGFKAIVEI